MISSLERCGTVWQRDNSQKHTQMQLFIIPVYLYGCPEHTVMCHFQTAETGNSFLTGQQGKFSPTNAWSDSPHWSLLEKCQSELQWWSEWPSSNYLQSINAGEGVEKREPSCTAGGNVNWYNHYGEQYGGSLKKKLKIKPPYDPAVPLLGVHPVCVHASLQSCPTLCDAMDCSPLGSSVMGFSRQEYWRGCHVLLQGIFQI